MNALHRAYAHYIRHQHGHPPSLAAERAVIATRNFLARTGVDHDTETVASKLRRFPALERLYNHYHTR